MKTEKSNDILLKIFETVITAILFIILFISISNINVGGEAERKTQLETAVRRSAMACYADEGAYPADIKYLEEHYGLSVDRSKYTVKYTVFAKNLMPDITVLEIADEE